jgi:hypothetical protein
VSKPGTYRRLVNALADFNNNPRPAVLAAFGARARISSTSDGLRR